MRKRRNSWNGMICSVLLMVGLIFTITFLSGCSDSKLKPIWTPEGWQAYKDHVKDSLTTIITVVITGLIPSSFGFISWRVKKKTKNTRNKNWLFIFVTGLFLAVGLTYFYFQQGHWGWGLLPIPAFILGILGILIIPEEFSKDDA